MATVVVSAPVSNKPTEVSGRAGRVLYWIVRRMYPDVKLHWIPDRMSIHEYAPMLQKLAARDTVLFSYFGHGVSDKICGQIPPGCGASKSGMIDTSNVHVLNNVICHATACWTSASLGRTAEENGVKAYLGSRAPCYVAFNMDEAPYRQFIIDVWNTFPIRLLEGDDFATALRAMMEKSKRYEAMFTENADEWLYGDYYATRFEKNRNILVPYGDLNATLI